MVFQLKSYLQFLWNSKNAHGVHSPFVFDLVTNCFYDGTAFPEYSTLEKYRKALLRNKNTIKVTDFGAGSKVFKSNQREISKMAKTAGITKKNAELLFRITRYFEPENILEIGTSLGLATSALVLGNLKSKVTTLEGCPETCKTAQSQFRELNIHPAVDFVVTEFESYLKKGSPDGKIQNLIYFDGNHQKAATLQYFEWLLETADNNSVWIFDDIHWSPEMEEAWKWIQEHPKVTVTIDTFQWGFVFFRSEQEKEHFVVRSSNSKILNAILGFRKLYGLLD